RHGWSLTSKTFKRPPRHLNTRGYRILVRSKQEPGGQTLSRFISPEALRVGITFTPSMRPEQYPSGELAVATDPPQLPSVSMLACSLTLRRVPTWEDNPEGGPAPRR